MIADDRKITVMQVFAAMGINPNPSVSWSVGSQVATMYANQYGEQPPKDNRPKTNGQGSHCFALYPYSWREKIEEVIAMTQAADDSQLGLFGE